MTFSIVILCAWAISAEIRLLIIQRVFNRAVKAEAERMKGMGNA